MILLIFLYILSAFLTFFINLEPFRTVGVFISICYLPGLCLFTLGKKEKLEFEDLILAFPCSIGISSILILGLLYFGVSIGSIINIIIIITGIAVLSYIIANRKNKLHITIKLGSNEIVFCFLAFLITLLLGIPILLGSDRIPISYLGFFHSAFVTQILNGIFPPENPLLGGTKINYYWGFHTFIAGLSSKTNFQPLKIMSILNLLSLFMIFCISYSVAKFFDFSERYRYLMPLAIIGLMSADAGIYFAAKLFFGNLPPLLNLPELAHPVKYYQILAFSQNFLTGWNDVRLLFFTKFYSATGMPLGVSLCFSYLLILLLLLKRNPVNKKAYLVSIGVVITASIITYLPLAIIPLIHAPIWAGFIFLSNNRQSRLKERFLGASEILLPYIIAVLVTLPYLLFVTSGGSFVRDKIISLDLYYQSYRNLKVFWLSYPVIIAGIWFAVKRLTFSKTLFFLLIGTLLCLFLSIFFRLPFDNSYKFDYILLFFFALFFVFALSNWLPSIHNRWLKGFITTTIVVLLMIAPFLVEVSYILSPWFRDTTYSFSGKHIIFAEDSVKNGAYKWIRENTPPEALVVLASIEVSDPLHDDNVIFIPAALTERNLFVIKDTDFTTGHPEHKRRFIFREKLFTEPDNPEVRKFFQSLNRPVYLLEEEDFNVLSENFKKEFPLKYSNNRQRVYLIQNRLQ